MAFAIARQSGTIRVSNDSNWIKYNITTTPASQLLNGSNPMNVYWEEGDTQLRISGFPSSTVYTGRRYFRWNGVNYIFYGQNIQGTSSGVRRLNIRSTESSNDGDPQSLTNGNAGLDKILDTSTASPSTTVSSNYTGATTLNVASTAGFPEATAANPQQGIIGTDVFTYTGFNAAGTAFTGVSALGNHNANSVVRPLIDIWEADDLHDLFGSSGFGSSTGDWDDFTVTTTDWNDGAAGGTNIPGIRPYTLTATSTATPGNRIIINVTARIVHEDPGHTHITCSTPSSGSFPKLWLQLCGWGDTSTTNQPRVTLGTKISGYAVGKVTITYDHSPGWGTTQPGDNSAGVRAVDVSGTSVTLKPDNSTTGGGGGKKYFFLMGLGSPAGYFETIHDGRSSVYTIELPNLDSSRFDFDTWNGGMTGEVAMAAYSNQNTNSPLAYVHASAGDWTPVTFTCSFKDIESKALTVDVSSNEITGVGGGTQNTSQLARLYPASIRPNYNNQFQRVDFSLWDSVPADTSTVAYDYPNPIFRSLDYGSNVNNAIVYTPGGAKPAGNKMNIQRRAHGSTNAGSWHYLLGITPNIQNTSGDGHDHGWMMSERTYENGTTTTTTAQAAAAANSISANTSGFPTSGWLRFGTDFIQYTATSATAFTVVTSGAGAIGATIPSGSTLHLASAFEFTNYNNNNNVRNLTTSTGKAHASFNPDLVHLDTGDHGAHRRYPGGSAGGFGYYMWELDGKEDGDKRGGVLQYGVNFGGGSNPANYYYRGTYDVYIGAPGRPTIIQNMRPMDDSNNLGITNQAPIISHNLYPGLTLANNGTIVEAESINFLQDVATGTNLLNLDDGSNHDFRTWESGLTDNATAWLATISSIPYIMSTTWSSKARGTSSPASGTKYADWSAYRGQDGYFARLSEFRGDFIQSVSNTKFTIKNPSGTSLTIITDDHIPTRDSNYDTIEISDGASTPNYGTWDLNGNGLDCSSTASHAYLQGDITDVRVHTGANALANAKGTNGWAIRDHNRLKGTLTVNVTNTDTYVSFDNCGIEAGSTFTVVRTGTGSGNLLIVDPPIGTLTSGTGANIVREITITRPTLDDESSAANVAGRLSVYNGNTLITSFIASGTGVSVASNTVTYTTNNTLSGITLPESGTLSYVWSGTGAEDFRGTFTVSSGIGSSSFILVEQSVPTARSYSGNAVYTPQAFAHTQINNSAGYTASSNPTSITVDSTTGFPSSGWLVIGDNRVRYTGTTSTTFTGIPANDLGSITSDISDDDAVQGVLVVRVTGNEVPSIDEMIFLGNTTIRSTANYNAMLNFNSSSVGAITNNSANFLQVDGTYVTFETGEAENKTLPYIQNITEDTPATPITQSRTISSTSYACNVVGSAPVISQALFRDLGVATTTDVNNARNVILGNL